MIEVRSLRKVFPANGNHTGSKNGQVVAVDDLSFACDRGEVFGLLGPNGAGKTTTLRILSTALRPTSGTIVVDGVDIVNDPSEVRRRIGFLSGSTGLYGRLTPREVATYFGRLYGLDDETISRRCDRLFERLGMIGFADRRCDTLSTGQKQKASIARTILHEPPIVVFDEPTSGLDVMTSREIIRLIEDCRSDSRCVVFSTHLMAEASKLCDRLVVIHEGRLLAAGTSDEILRRTGADDLEDAFLELVEVQS
jgi:sodium transport system ATP-binding protein